MRKRKMCSTEKGFLKIHLEQLDAIYKAIAVLGKFHLPCQTRKVAWIDFGLKSMHKTLHPLQKRRIICVSKSDTSGLSHCNRFSILPPKDEVDMPHGFLYTFSPNVNHSPQLSLYSLILHPVKKKIIFSSKQNFMTGILFSLNFELQMNCNFLGNFFSTTRKVQLWAFYWRNIKKLLTDTSVLSSLSPQKESSFWWDGALPTSGGHQGLPWHHLKLWGHRTGQVALPAGRTGGTKF